MSFWKKKKAEVSREEYLGLVQQIELIWIEIDILNQRYKRKVKPPKPEEEFVSDIEDGMNDLRKLNKDYPPQ